MDASRLIFMHLRHPELDPSPVVGTSAFSNFLAGASQLSFK